MRQDVKGFTLMELMVTLAIIAIAATFAIPNIIAYMPKQRMNRAARDLYADIQSARLRAVKSKDNVAINFALGPNNYTIFIDNGAGGGIDGNAIQDGAEQTIRTGTFPFDVTMTQAAFGGAPPTATGYTPRGLIINNKIGTVQLENAAHNLYKQIVFRMSGNAIIRTSTDGGATFN